MGTVNDYIGIAIDTVEVTIANTETISGAGFFAGLGLVGIIFPAGMDGTTIGFEVSDDNDTFSILEDNASAPITVSVNSSGQAQPLTPADFVAWKFVKVTSDSAETPAKVIKLIPYRV